MSVSNRTAALCQYCGRPIGGVATWLGGMPYHPECTHGPGYPTHYQAPTLSVDDVRRIVREELAHNA